MKCPKCGYVSFNFLDNCKKCGKDLLKFKEDNNIFELPPGKLALLYFDEHSAPEETSAAVEEGGAKPAQEGETTRSVPGVGLGDGEAGTSMVDQESISPAAATNESEEGADKDDLTKSLEKINFELMKDMGEEEEFMEATSEADEPGKIKLHEDGDTIEFEIDEGGPVEEEEQ